MYRILHFVLILTFRSYLLGVFLLGDICEIFVWIFVLWISFGYVFGLLRVHGRVAEIPYFLDH